MTSRSREGALRTLRWTSGASEAFLSEVRDALLAEGAILRTAARRREQCAPPWTKALKAEAAHDVAAVALLKRGLLTEALAAKTSLAWRTPPTAPA
jgi:hypothetical protein